MLKVLVVGNFLYDIYEPALVSGFKALGCDVSEFATNPYFFKENSSIIELLFFKVQEKFTVGPALKRLNADLISVCQKEKYDFVFCYRGVAIQSNTISHIQKTGALVFGYNNDDPFGKTMSWMHWRYFISSIKKYDFVFSYRHKNIMDYRWRGVKNTGLLRSYYLHVKNFPLKTVDNASFNSDIVFAGHYEADGRDTYIRRLIDDIGGKAVFKLYGARKSWQKSEYMMDIEKYLGYNIHPVIDDYNLVLNKAKIALVFLSKANNDSYTRRCFEIPAAKTFMLCEYTDDMASMFKEGVEAEYFRDYDEFLAKISYYLEHEDEREKIALNGYNRLKNDGHEVTDRAKQIIDVYQKIQKEEGK